ncbi:hypothetical protein [Micromonospora sp. HK10]|uniref:hypothetical protein n=1 Tax=Micromonospora sp. HK10 TaxID=1538294 RepID=UPI0012E197FB|nr:hypothetical protein [Micromonospora sp. HK10]
MKQTMRSVLNRHPPTIRLANQCVRHHHSMSTRSPHGRDVVNRIEAAAMLGISVSHLDRLYRERDSNGFPERAADGRTWHRQDIADYELPREQATRSARDSVDRSGDPDELVDTATAARILGYRDRSALAGNNPVWLRLQQQVDDESLTPSGRKRRRWKRRTVWAIAENRIGKGGATRTGRPAGTPHGHPDRSGNPDELVGKAEAARVLGYSTANALPNRVLERADEQTAGPKGRYRRKWRRETLWAILDEQGSTPPHH